MNYAMNGICWPDAATAYASFQTSFPLVFGPAESASLTASSLTGSTITATLTDQAGIPTVHTLPLTECTRDVQDMALDHFWIVLAALFLVVIGWNIGLKR